jgi:ankyrin repeat protein
MLHDEWIEYLKRKNKSGNFRQIENSYIPRKLKRFIQIDRKLLETKKDDLIIVHTEEEFNEKCRQNPLLKNIHYLIQDRNNQNQFKWQMSTGPVSALNGFIAKQDNESIEEEKIFQKSNEKILVIAAEPGMGKSLILDHFTQNSSAENFFLKIILNTCTKSLSDANLIETLQNNECLIEFVLKSFLNKNDQQEILLLKNLAQEEKLTLMFDGLDEVTDYKEQIIQLIDALNKDNRIKKLVITTRNHLRQELEDHYRTFSFNLNTFDYEDQKNFLYNYWRSLNLKSKERPTSIDKYEQNAEYLIERIKSMPSQSLNELIGIPLQTKMLADIYFERVKNNEDFSHLKLNNIAELYNEFIESKIRYQVERANNFKIEQLSKKLKNYFEDTKEKFYSDHTKLSSLILFEENNQNEVSSDEKIQEILAYGIIIEFTSGVPTFLHQSFAEFFLAKTYLQKMKEQKRYDKELEQILRDRRHFLIRKFLNDLMEIDVNQQEHREEKKNENEDFKREIENCCRENLLHLLKYFIQDRGANLKTKNQFLIEASYCGHNDIFAFLLEKGIDVNQQDKWDGKTALIWASEQRHKEIALMLLQHKNIEINLQDKIGNTALMLASKYGHKDIVQMLLEHKDIEVNKQDNYSGTALIEASKDGHKVIVEMLLQHKNIDINQQNKIGSNALIEATRYGQTECAKILLQHENINVNQHDHIGYTALMLASFLGNKEIVEIVLKDTKTEINKKEHSGSTALMLASQKGQKEIVEILLRNESININQQDYSGYNALMWASREGQTEIVRMLLQYKGIQINHSNRNGYTALIEATIWDHSEIVEMLLQNVQIHVNLQDNWNGFTALMLASKRGLKEIVQILLQNENVKINQQDKNGKTALTWASGGGHKAIVEILLQNENIDINKKDNFGSTALADASYNGHEEIAQMLRAKEIHTNK